MKEIKRKLKQLNMQHLFGILNGRVIQACLWEKLNLSVKCRGRKPWSGVVTKKIFAIKEKESQIMLAIKAEFCLHRFLLL